MTLAEIARLAGVSRTTASYVINGQAETRRISQDTVDRVMAVVERHRYRVDPQAAALRRGSSRTLGLVVPDLENATYARLAKRLERGAREAGYQLLIAGSDDRPEVERDLALALRARRCEVLITASSLPMDDPFYAELQAEGLPVVAVDRGFDAARFASVVSNDAEAAERLAASVLSPGTSRVVWLDAVPGLSITQERRGGFQRALAGGEAEAVMLSGERYDRAEGAELMRRVIDEHGLPGALVTASYSLFDGVLDTLLEAGGLPASLRLATFGDSRLLEFLPVAVNSAEQDHDRMAEATLESALAAARGEGAPGQRTVPRRMRWRAGRHCAGTPGLR